MQNSSLARFGSMLGKCAAMIVATASLIAMPHSATAQSEKSSPAINAAGADALPLDLSRVYTRRYKTNDLQGFAGRRELDGLPFDINGEFTLFGRENDVRRNIGQMEVDGIQIGRKFDELHLLHTVQWREHFGCPVAVLRLHYTDGSTNDLSLRYNYEVNDWNRLLSEEKEVIADPNTKIVWRGPGIYKGTARLFKSVLKNPHPEKDVASMDVISTRTRASYTLVAATVAKSDPHREVTPGLPLGPDYHFDGALKVTVLDKETGAPIPGAEVYPSMSIEDEGVVADPILTDADGTATVKYPVDRTAYLGVQVSKEGYLRRSENWRSAGIPKTITYRLVAGKASIGGTVVDASSAPVAGAQLSLSVIPTGDLDEVTHPANDSATTDAEGRWHIEGLPENFEAFGLTVSHPEFPQARFYPDELTRRGFIGVHIATSNLFAGTAVLKLTRGNSLAGTVKDAEGKPLADASIFVAYDRYMSGAVRAKTDANGSFKLKNLGAGQNYLTITAKGFAPAFLEQNVTGDDAPVAATLKPGKTLRGRVVDSAGTPIADAEVSYEGLAARNGRFTGRTIEWKTKTDAAGNFAWDSAPAEPILLNITKPGRMALEWQSVETGATNVHVFTLAAPLVLTGEVTDEETGKPLPNFTVTPGWPEGNGGARFEKRRATKGQAGHYEATFDHPIIIRSPADDFVFQISAPGYAPVRSRAIHPGEGAVTWDAKLKKTPSLVGIVETPDGRPVPGVKVWFADPREYLRLAGTQLEYNNSDAEFGQTDETGHFELPPQNTNCTLVAASRDGFAISSLSDKNQSLTLTLQPWSRVEGTLTRNGQVLPDREMYFFIGDGSDQVNISTTSPAKVDGQGRFTFPVVPPGPIRITLKKPLGENSWTYAELQSLEVKPGATNVVNVSIDGRDLVGHWKRDESVGPEVTLDNGNIYLRPDLARPPVPKEFDEPEKIQAWYQTWMKTDEGKKYMAAMRRGGGLQMNPDGTLRGEAVEPGKYTVSGSFWGRDGASAAELVTRSITIPPVAAGDSNAPFDIGEFVIKGIKHLKNGDLAPEFSVPTLDDKSLKLSDYRGKYVLVDFWATWCGPCVAETPSMKAAYDAYGSDPRFVMISLSLDDSKALPKKFAQTHDIKWLQGFLGDWSKDNVTKDYCVQGIPSIFLIGPDGKIIAQNLRGEAIKNAVSTALRSK